MKHLRLCTRRNTSGGLINPSNELVTVQEAPGVGYEKSFGELGETTNGCTAPNNGGLGPNFREWYRN